MSLSTSPVRSRRAGLATAIAAATLALTFGAVTSSASAADLSSGHVDYVSVAANGASALKLGSNYEDTAWVAASTYTLKVPSTSGASGTGYILPESSAEAASRGVPFAGFSGDESLRSVGFVAGDAVTIKLDSVTFAPAAGVTGTGTVAVTQGGAAWYGAAGSSHTFTITGTADEAFHQHAKWVFSKAGTYTLKFSATGKGKSAGSTTYTVKAGV
ncbi:hypothetical protein GCM10027515_07830 [Schumannella luteola]|uniref:Surface-anchored protein n=1 Tax=Schumannella luteola TaxID=472059 RepID=A0A852YEG4_9MICO|nr:choice-of-anchor M domain-containing protein [Schumannella luteola]NYG98087.1 surface-anchored protein [Schumannella luteola]TPX01811.1 hypothetical protein FJ656_25830 [Schumannella luteola]